MDKSAHSIDETMRPTLHMVASNELPELKEWLEKYLPDSFKLYNTVRETLEGRWRGTTFVTLGWPGILAAGEGEPDTDSACYEFHSYPRTTSVYAPCTQHLETLLLYPGYLEWSQPIVFQAVSAKLRPTIVKLGKVKGGNCAIKANVMLQASQADLPPRPIPEGFHLRALDPDLHTDYIMSTWPHSRTNTDLYIKDLLRRFPSVGLFNKHDECIGLEIGNEYGAIGMLHVREEFRGRGLGKIITSQLAQKYFCDSLPVIALVIKSNEPSRRMHTSSGFKEITDVDWIIYYSGDLQELFEKIGYNDKS